MAALLASIDAISTDSAPQAATVHAAENSRLLRGDDTKATDDEERGAVQIIQGTKFAGVAEKSRVTLDDLFKFERLFEANVTPTQFYKALRLKGLKGEKAFTDPEFIMYVKYKRYFDEQQPLKLPD